MQSTSPCGPTQPRRLVASPSVILTAFAQVCDPRWRQGRRYPLAALLALAVAAILSNHVSVLAIAPWGHEQAWRSCAIARLACFTRQGSRRSPPNSATSAPTPPKLFASSSISPLRTHKP